MTEESFLSRWARLKREGARASQSHESQHESGMRTGPPSVPEIDPGDLPPIDSLTAESDITPFLSPGVPAETTRAALRTVWQTDPRIRDFVEMADNQWDFNTPEAMPGFGELGAVERARQLLVQTLSSGSEPESPPVNPRPDPPSLAASETAASDSTLINPVWRPAAAQSLPAEPASSSGDMGTPEVSLTEPRLHGSALPR